MKPDYDGYEPVIGLEVHAQLLTRTKAFCACRAAFGDEPNTNTCPVCLGLPGALPVLNAGAVELAIRASLALGCAVQPTSVFARKNYFYPDLPKGYQISQYDLPLATKGELVVDVDGEVTRVGITRVHMEEDAGKNVHAQGNESVVDLNRAGVPLVEIVSEPDLRSAAQAAEYLKRLRELLMFMGVNDGNLEQGSFRCDANVSVRRPGEPYGTRVELKNINSFKFVADAIDVEVRRQVEMLSRGERVRQQTRGYNAEKRVTFMMRDKENEAGYRYFPEPDLPPLRVDAATLERAKGALREAPAEKRRRFVEVLGLTPYAAAVLTSHPRVAAFFERTASRARGTDPVKIANFVQAEVLRDTKQTGLDASFPASAEHVAGLLALVDAGTISGKQAKEVWAAMIATGKAPEVIVEEKGLRVMSDEGAIVAMANDVLAANAKQADAYRSGKTGLFGFFVGQLMKKTGGSGDPALVNAVLKRLLDGAAAPAPAPAPPERSTPKPEAAKPVLMPERPAETTEPAGAAAPEPVVPYAEFAKVDIRVGLVREAARVPRKDKLLDLRVDVGDPGGPRRIVAELALTFAPEALVGKRVLVVCNLEPRAFSKELVSHGMILATGPSDALELPSVTDGVPVGTKVK